MRPLPAGHSSPHGARESRNSGTGRNNRRREKCVGLRGLRRTTISGPRPFPIQRPAARLAGLRALHAKTGRPRQGGRVVCPALLREAPVFDARAGPRGRLRCGHVRRAKILRGVPRARRRYSGARFWISAPLYFSLARGRSEMQWRTRGPPLPLRRARPRAQLLGAERLGFVCLRGPRPAEGVEEERGRRRDTGLGGDGRRGAARARPEGLRAPDGPRGPAGGLRCGARVQRRGGAAPDLPLRGARGARGLLLRLVPASLALPSLRVDGATHCESVAAMAYGWRPTPSTRHPSRNTPSPRACEHEPRPQAGTSTRSSCSWP